LAAPPMTRQQPPQNKKRKRLTINRKTNRLPVKGVAQGNQQETLSKTRTKTGRGNFFEKIPVQPGKECLIIRAYYLSEHFQQKLRDFCARGNAIE